MRWLILFLLLWLSPLQASFNPTAEESVTALLEKEARKDLPPGVEVTIQSIYISGRVPEKATLYQLTPTPPVGMVQFQLSGAGNATPVYGNAVIKVVAPIAISKVAIKTGEDFDKENITFQKRDLTPFLQKGYFTDFDKMRGIKALGFIRPGSVVTSMQTQKSWDIQQGQSVELTHQKGVLVVSARVKSLENGRTNDWIRVENPDSHKIIKVRVSGLGLVSTR